MPEKTAHPIETLRRVQDHFAAKGIHIDPTRPTGLPRPVMRHDPSPIEFFHMVQGHDGVTDWENRLRATELKDKRLREIADRGRLSEGHELEQLLSLANLPQMRSDAGLPGVGRVHDLIDTTMVDMLRSGRITDRHRRFFQANLMRMLGWNDYLQGNNQLPYRYAPLQYLPPIRPNIEAAGDEKTASGSRSHLQRLLESSRARERITLDDLDPLRNTKYHERLKAYLDHPFQLMNLLEWAHDDAEFHSQGLFEELETAKLGERQIVDQIRLLDRVKRAERWSATGMDAAENADSHSYSDIEKLHDHYDPAKDTLDVERLRASDDPMVHHLAQYADADTRRRLETLHRRIEDAIQKRSSRGISKKTFASILDQAEESPGLLDDNVMNKILGIDDRSEHHQSAPPGSDASKTEQNSDQYTPYWDEQTGYEGTPYWKIHAFLSELHLTKKDVLYDLGSGHGRVPIFAALTTPVGRAVGIELLPHRAEASERARLRHKLDNVEFRTGNVLDHDFSDGTVFFLFNPFSRETLKKVSDQLRSLETPFRIVSSGDCNKHFSDQPWLKDVTDKTGRLDSSSSLRIYEHVPGSGKGRAPLTKKQ